MYGNKAREFVVYKRQEEANCIVKTDIHYKVGESFDKPLEWNGFEEKYLFATKKELIDSL